MRAVELFAGIGGFRIASDRCGFKTVWANDICPFASTVYTDKFDGHGYVQGDIFAELERIPQHDLLTGGFPCQPFSSAGKKRGIQDPRGTLFNAIVKVLRTRRPKYFVLENVKRLLTMEHGRHFATILSALSALDYRIEWRLLNAVNFGLAQNRERVVIVGAREQPRRRNPFLRDESLCSVLANADDVAACSSCRVSTLRAVENWPEIATHNRKFPSWGLAWKGRFVGHDLDHFSDRNELIGLKSVLQEQAEVGPEFDFTESTLARIASSESVNKFVSGVEILSNQSGGARMGYTVFGINGLAPTLTATPSRHYERYHVDGAYRRLTNVEYARLQGFPDSHCEAVSVYQQYGLYGNAVPPPMVEWVLRRLENPSIPLSKLPAGFNQVDLFANV